MRPGRAGLWFSGEASGECIISWPGFPEQEVFEIRDALLKLAGSQEAFTPDPLAQSAETKPDISFSFEYAGRLYQALSRVITISTILGPVILSFASTYVASAYGLLPNGSYAGALLLGLLFIFMTSALLVYKKLRALLTMHFTDKGAARFNSNSVALVQKTQTITLYYQDIQSLQPIYTRDYLSELRIQTSVQNVRIQSSSKEAILAEEEWKASQQRNPLTLDSEKRKKRQEIFGGTSLGKLYKELRIRRGSGSGQQSKPNC
jgi:hypothetical protein